MSHLLPPPGIWGGWSTHLYCLIILNSREWVIHTVYNRIGLMTTLITTPWVPQPPSLFVCECIDMEHHMNTLIGAFWRVATLPHDPVSRITIAWSTTRHCPIVKSLCLICPSDYTKTNSKPYPIVCTLTLYWVPYWYILVIIILSSPFLIHKMNIFSR